MGDDDKRTNVIRERLENGEVELPDPRDRGDPFTLDVSDDDEGGDPESCEDGPDDRGVMKTVGRIIQPDGTRREIAMIRGLAPYGPIYYEVGLAPYGPIYYEVNPEDFVTRPH